MGFRIAMLNMERDEKRWEKRRELIIDQLGELKPDLFAVNEVSIHLQTGRWLQRATNERHGLKYALVQQSKTNSSSTKDGEALLSRFPVLETANLDYQAGDMVALACRVEIDKTPVDIYVTHLYKSRGEDSLRLYQVQQLLAWIDSRDDVPVRVVCGDFNATLDKPSAALMASVFKPSQTDATAFTPLADADGSVSHPYWQRFDRCIDYIWVAGALKVKTSGVCFKRPSPDDSTLWPSDHVGVWADLELTSP